MKAVWYTVERRHGRNAAYMKGWKKVCQKK